ncbi:hypothetical protein A1356_16105 [Methylomonas koyamae]|uniref:Uncharacterized protein n=2 Tax=Methylomonas koyamae TaxID=702114 RepID=A0AA91I4E8_9GAMM|nr:hypothetical protein A1356_16105 [Methylomonas koyamae]
MKKGSVRRPYNDLFKVQPFARAAGGFLFTLAGLHPAGWRFPPITEGIAMSFLPAPVSEILYLNQYRCPYCQIQWDDEWNCACNDRCPSCNAEISPYHSEVLTEENPSPAYAVTYTLDYTHRVVVGIVAESADGAQAVAEAAFDDGTIWDDTPEMPLLFDDFEEVDGKTPRWQVEAVDVWPKADASVVKLRQERTAMAVCRGLIDAYQRGKDAGGSIDWDNLDQLLTLAKQALGLSDSDPAA